MYNKNSELMDVGSFDVTHKVNMIYYRTLLATKDFTSLFYTRYTVKNKSVF